MIISATSFRILRYLNDNKGFLIPETALIRPLRIRIREDLTNAIMELQNKELVSGGKGNVSCKLQGEQYYNKIVRDNLELVYNEVFENYDYAILKFLHYNDWGPREKEFPQILQTKSPVEPFEDYLYQQWNNIKNEDGCYFLKPEGKEQYHFETKRREKIKDEKKYTGIYVGDNSFIATNSIIDKVKLKTANENNFNTQKKSWLEKLAPFVSVVGKFIGKFVGV